MAQTTDAELVRIIRAITRLQTQARKLRRQLKANQAALRLERRHLRAVQATLTQRADVAPMRLFAGAVGIPVRDDAAAADAYTVDELRDQLAAERRRSGHATTPTTTAIRAAIRRKTAFGGQQ